MQTVVKTQKLKIYEYFANKLETTCIKFKGRCRRFVNSLERGRKISRKDQKEEGRFNQSLFKCPQIVKYQKQLSKI